jgi:signal transduction histidine kinase
MDKMKEKSLETSLVKLEKVAAKSNNDTLVQLAKKVKNDTVKLYNEKVQIEKENEIIKKDLGSTKEELKLRKTQNYFLKSATTNKVENLLGASHLARINSLTIKNEIKNLFNYVKRNNLDMPDQVIEKLAQFDLITQRIISLLECAEDANFSTKSDIMTGDICLFTEEYIKNFYSNVEDGVKVTVRNNVEEVVETNFKPSNISIIFDNLISNSDKAEAQNAQLTIKKNGKYIEMIFTDDGQGIDKTITNPDILFELGITTTRGSGIGLYHIKKIIEEMNGTVYINKAINKGFEIGMRVKI